MNIITRTVNDYSMLSVKKWLEQGLEHGFMNAQLNISEDDGELWDNVYPGSSIKLLKQTHGTHIVSVLDQEFTYNNGSPSNADGWFIDLLHAPYRTAFGVKTADCAPVIVFINSLRAVYLLHCGWRSAVDNFLPKVLLEIYNKYSGKAQVDGSNTRAMCKVFNKSVETKSLVRDVEICVGPAAKSCHYEVKDDVTTPAIKNFLELGGTKDMLSHVIVQRDGNTYFDIQELLKQQSLLLGIPEGNFASANVCTISDKSYFSFRRQGGEVGSTGHQVSFVKI